MKRLVCLLVVVAAAVALAGFYLPSSAATVGGTSISRQSLDSDLSAIAGSPDYTCFLSEERQLTSGKTLPFLGAGTPDVKGGIYDSTFVDDWLASMITTQIDAEVLAGHRLHVTPADLVIARRVLADRITQVLDQYARVVGSPSPGCGGNGRTVLSTLPGWFVREQTGEEADQIVLDARAAGAGLSQPALMGYFVSHRRSFDRDCLALVLVRTKSAAAGVEAALARGTSFAQEAAAVSVTSSSAARGGSVGCGFVGDTFLATAVDHLGVGGTTTPVHVQGAYWIVRLTSRSTVPFATARSSVVTAIIHAGQRRADAELTAALRGVSVGVDPRYGTAAHHRLTLVLGAPSPPGTSEISTVANLPTLTAASS